MTTTSELARTGPSRRTVNATFASERALCPHCALDIPNFDAGTSAMMAMRCPHCRLVIGAGRALAVDGQANHTRSCGTAAGVLAGSARREGSLPGDSQAVALSLLAAAASLGCSVKRLRMLDYQLETERDPSLPSLGVVLATHGSWKVARQAAAEDGYSAY